jgi:MFS family permease
MEDIEQRIRAESGAAPVPPHGSITVHRRTSFGLGPIMSAMLGSYRSHSLLALTLMTAQAFLFNAVFFSYGLVLSTFHGVPERMTGIYPLPLAVSNFLGPVLLAPLFDIVGRRKMIAGTYAASGLLLSVTALLLGFDAFTAWTQTIARKTARYRLGAAPTFICNCMGYRVLSR